MFTKCTLIVAESGVCTSRHLFLHYKSLLFSVNIASFSEFLLDFHIKLLLCLLAYSRLGVATVDICIFMTWQLFYGRMPFLPPTLYSEGKLGHLSST